MWLRRLAVAHWRGLDFDLGDLAPGMNLIFGPNESGKSRLVEALRFALFESSSGRSSHKRALATWSVAPGKPRVTVEFELCGTPWKLEKEFLGTGHNTVLRSGTTTFEGAEAEARLAELMGAGAAGRGELKPEDRGIWSLLWVDQGASRDAPAHNVLSQARIQDSLTREIGEVAAGELGERTLRRAEALRHQFYTATRDAEKALLTEPRAKVEHLRHRLQEAVARRDAVAADADELDRKRTAERDLVTRIAKAEQRLGDVRGKHDLAIELSRRLDVYDEQVRTCESGRARCLEGLQAVQSLCAQIDRLTEQMRESEGVQAAADENRQAAQRLLEEASEAAADADRQYTEQERQVIELRRTRELARTHEQAERLRARLAAASGVDDRVAAIQQALAGLPRVTVGDVERLRRGQEALGAARARLEGASASLELKAHRDLRVSGETLASGSIRRTMVEDELHLDVEGILSITLRPGGGELPKLRDAVNDAERALTRACESLGVVDSADAERVAAQRRDQENELTRCRAELESHFPEGRDGAEAELRGLEARLVAAGDPKPEPVTADELEAAESRLRDLATRREELRARRDVALDRVSAAREEAASRNADLDSRRRQLEETVARRASLPDRASLEAELGEADRQWRERVAARDEMDARFEALGGDDIQLDLEQAERACAQLKDEHHQIRLQCTHLQARLESAGDDGRHEQVQELAAELARAESELAGIERQAAAAKRLHDVLLEEYEAARERLTQPVIARIRPYLATLFPDAEVWLDDDLNLKGLRSQDADQHFEALSGGAREQLSLLVRIGLAEVVGADEPWPLVLDDVLVNTDAERIRLVQRLLFQASRRMQILLFTCHGPLFDALGADRRIELPPRDAVGAISRSRTSVEVIS